MKPVKTLLAICSGLMATASLMGTIDYSKASKSGELKYLYRDEEETLDVIPFLNNEKLRPSVPPPPSLGSFSRAPIRQRDYIESESRAELKAANEENDKLYKDQRARAKAAPEIANRKKLHPPPEINFSSFGRADLRKLYIKSTDEKVPNDK